jgi:hypothetical protein
MDENNFPDESYVYFNCKECNALFSTTHYFADIENFICDDCLDKE